MIAAQDIAQLFLQKINQSGAPYVASWEVARFINIAQSQLWRSLVYNDRQKQEIDLEPISTFQDSRLVTEILLPFQRVIGSKDAPSYTDNSGFLEQPQELGQHTSLSVWTGTECDGDLIRCEFVRDQDLSRVMFDAFRGPRWPGRRALPNSLTPYNPIYTTETTGPSNVAGYRVYPKGKYAVELRYIIFPPDMAISNQTGTPFEDEQNYPAGTFVDTLQNIDLVWPASEKQRLVTLAAEAFSLSTPDPAQYQLEAQRGAQMPN